MSAQTSLFNSADVPRRPRLVRDGPRGAEPNPVDSFALRSGEMYRISYAVGDAQQRRVTRSIAVYGGQSERRLWGGDLMPCLDFALPQGRTLSLLGSQLIDARLAELNERGQWVLQHPDGHRHRAARRQYSGMV